MRGSSKGFVAGAVALLLAVVLVACGGGDDSSSTAAEAAPQTQAEGQSDTSSSGTKSGGEGEPTSGEGEAEASGGSTSTHSDSGGGSQQYRVSGGDNSIQDFGKEADTSERDAAAEALHNFLDARAEGDGAAACEYMANTITESLEKLASKASQIEDKSCGGILEKLTNSAAQQAMKAEAEQADVGSLRTDGERAFVIYTGAEGAVFAMPMKNEGGTWKVASIAGTPLS